MNQKYPIHIVVIASYFYPKIGGLENYAYLLAKELHSSGDYTISVITSNYADKGYKKEIIDGMTVHRLPIWFNISNTPINLIWYWWLKKIFTAEKPDIIHLHSPVPYLPDMASIAAQKIPIVLTYHSGSMLKNKWPIDILITIYEKIYLHKLFKRANAVVAISQDFAKHRFPQFIAKTSFIPTGVDLTRFKKSPLPTQTEVVTFVGRIEHTSSWKGIEQLLQAMVIVLKNRPEAKLQLVGGGDAIPHYRNRAKELNIDTAITFFGPLVGNDLVDAYKKSNVIVLPSTSDSEAFSVSLVEAMASGRPIIGTTIGGTPQVISHGENGLLVPPKNPEKLAEAITLVLRDQKLAQRLADNGSRRAQEFSWSIRSNQYRQIFQKINVQDNA